MTDAKKNRRYAEAIVRVEKRNEMETREREGEQGQRNEEAKEPGGKGQSGGGESKCSWT